MKLKNYKINKKGFTLIELLVVVATIGVLSGIVLSSLNTARDKGKAAAIKSNLKNMGLQMELAYSDNGSYAGISAAGNQTAQPTLPSTVCIGPIANMAQSIISSGAKARCLSTNFALWLEVNQRWGASGLIYSSSAPVKAWSASNMGVVTWDAQGVNPTGAFVSTDVIMTWDAANTACGLA